MCVVGVTPLGICDFALGRLIIVLDNCSLAFDGVSFFAYTSVLIVERCWRCPIDQYCIQGAISVGR